MKNKLSKEIAKRLLNMKSVLLSKAVADQQDKLYRKMNDVLNIIRTRQANYIFGTEDEEHQERQAVIRAMRKLVGKARKYVKDKELDKSKSKHKKKLNKYSGELGEKI